MSEGRKGACQRKTETPNRFCPKINFHSTRTADNLPGIHIANNPGTKMSKLSLDQPEARELLKSVLIRLRRSVHISEDDHATVSFNFGDSSEPSCIRLSIEGSDRDLAHKWIFPSQDRQHVAYSELARNEFEDLIDDKSIPAGFFLWEFEILDDATTDCEMAHLCLTHENVRYGKGIPLIENLKDDLGLPISFSKAVRAVILKAYLQAQTDEEEERNKEVE